jgi:hypothetical protein
MARTSCIQWDDDVRCVLYQHAYLDFHIASALRQQSAGRATHSDANHLLIHSDIKILFNAWVLTSADLNILIMFVNSNNQLF